MKLTLKLDTFFVVSSLLAGVTALFLHGMGPDHSRLRVPSGSSTKTFELHLQSLALSQNTRVKPQEKVFLRATFDGNKVMELGKNDSWSLNPGEEIPLDFKIDIDSRWVKDDQLEFKLELMAENWFTTTLVRCAQVSKELSVYNRGYKCFIPGEPTPLLSYRLSEKGAPIPKSLPVASN